MLLLDERLIGCLLAGIEGIYNKSIKRYSEELVREWVRQGLPRCYGGVAAV